MSIGQEKDLQQTWEDIEKQLNENPAPIQGLNVSYGFNLTGEEKVSYVLVLGDKQASVNVQETDEADCVLSMSVDDFYKLLAGKLNTTTAFMMGKLKVKGSLGLALKLENILTQYQF
ncbi:SCP2 sterol-binding domain-containing protein [Sporosarcina aquimarina]|uniref:SCP2 sterol-binding domain-containing protein n=1 Tax=Sporosarcina aquimarina TaxID=114975 RepID=A0ABU4G379_9BACL|nr:SCP2 sterol-binding domain-containing protein [Sporosarcina aquimarina]MDW0110768.1 SCP2 sterol-binding domain-containing protein [Sporosarcina aquimarina]